MNVPKFNEREKALENDYIRRKEYVLPSPTFRNARIYTPQTFRFKRVWN